MARSLALIVGGTSGLGLELAKRLKIDYEVQIIGRHNPLVEGLSFRQMDLSSYVADEIPYFLTDLGENPVSLFIYAAGYYQEGSIDKLSCDDIEEMISVGLTAPAIFLSSILSKQEQLDGFIAITSTSQWTPRLEEPIYTGVKSGLGMLANSISLDPRVGKVLVAGPAGMRTNFWVNNPRDMSTMLDPAWVAAEIIELYEDEFEYRFAKILREPARVEIVETRQ